MMISNPFKTAFGVFEGIDYSGKSEQFERTKTFLTAYHERLPVTYAKEPDRTRPTGATIYEILEGKHQEYRLENLSPSHFQTFYIEDRMLNYRSNILPALFRGRHVIQDRGAASSFAYGADSPKDFFDFMGMHERIFSAAEMPFIWPDFILIFDVPVDVALARASQASRAKDKFEVGEKLERARANYLAFAQHYPNCHIIDGDRKPEDIFVEVKGYVYQALGLNREAQ